jgi:hypothetical protein
MQGSKTTLQLFDAPLFRLLSAVLEVFPVLTTSDKGRDPGVLTTMISEGPLARR